MAIFWFLLVLPFIHGSVYSGFTIGREFEYLGKFCYGWNKNMSEIVGFLHGNIHTEQEGLQIVIYDDQAHFWEYIISNKSCNCECKTSPQHTKAIFNVTKAQTIDEFYTFDMDIHEHLRPRFWYVALARCVPGGETFVPSFTHLTEAKFEKYYFTAYYEIEMTQGDGSQVPVYQEGLSMIYGIMALLSSGLVMLQSYAARWMQHSESFHPILKILTTIVGLFFGSNLLLWIHFVLYEYNGIGMGLFWCIARIIQVFNRVMTILLAMLIAKGWTINTVVLSGQEQLTFVMGTLFTLYLSLAMWYLIWLDPASTLYLYDSWPGMCICTLQLGVLGWFHLTIRDTKKFEDVAVKRQFFFRMSLLLSIYLVALPILVTIASFLSPWVREKIVDSLTILIEFTIYSILIYLLWPSRAPKYFERLYSASSQAEKTTLNPQDIPTEEL